MTLKALFGSASVLAAVAALASPAYAQEAETAAQPQQDASAGSPVELAQADTQQEAQTQPQSTLHDIIVTATRRNSNLQTTAVAVSAIDQNLIQQASPRNVGDLAVFVPNFSAATITGFNAASFSIRGVGQNNIIVYFEPPVAVLVDDFVVPSVQTQLLDTFDVEQVEVLRGPQGTLFGKNTTGGAVTVRTKRPVMNRIGIDSQILAGSFGTFNANAAVNVPIIHDKLALRAVIGHDGSNGYYRNGACYGPVVSFTETKWQGATGCGDGKTVGGNDVWHGRAKLLWEPTPDIKALLQYEYLRDRSDSIPTVAETPLDPASGYLFSLLGVAASNPAAKDPLDNAGISNRQGALQKMASGQRIDVNGLYLNVDFSTKVGTITSVSGIRWQDSQLPNTYTGQAPVAADGDVLSLFDANRSDNRKTWQQELRFASDLGGPFDFVSGVFYQNDQDSFCVAQALGFQDLVGGSTPYGDGTWNDNPYILCNAQKAHSTAVYTEGTYKITPTVSLTLGGRYSWEKKTWYGRQQIFAEQLNGGSDPSIVIHDALDANVFDYPAGVIKVKSKASEPTWRASLSWKVTPSSSSTAPIRAASRAAGSTTRSAASIPSSMLTAVMTWAPLPRQLLQPGRKRPTVTRSASSPNSSTIASAST